MKRHFAPSRLTVSFAWSAVPVWKIQYQESPVDVPHHLRSTLVSKANAILRAAGRQNGEDLASTIHLHTGNPQSLEPHVRIILDSAALVLQMIQHYSNRVAVSHPLRHGVFQTAHSKVISGGSRSSSTLCDGPSRESIRSALQYAAGLSCATGVGSRVIAVVVICGNVSSGSCSCAFCEIERLAVQILGLYRARGYDVQTEHLSVSISSHSRHSPLDKAHSP